MRSARQHSLVLVGSVFIIYSGQWIPFHQIFRRIANIFGISSTSSAFRHPWKCIIYISYASSCRRHFHYSLILYHLAIYCVAAAIHVRARVFPVLQRVSDVYERTFESVSDMIHCWNRRWQQYTIVQYAANYIRTHSFVSIINYNIEQ